MLDNFIFFKDSFWYDFEDCLHIYVQSFESRQDYDPHPCNTSKCEEQIEYKFVKFSFYTVINRQIKLVHVMLSQGLI